MKINWYKKAEALKDVDLKGKLKQRDNGFVYLDVPDSFTDGIFPILDIDGAQKPPRQTIGTHISVMYEDECEDVEIKELGNEYSFQLGDLKSANPEGWDEVDTVYFVQVSSPELEDLRKKYDLSKKLNGHEFHITVGIEKD